VVASQHSTFLAAGYGIIIKKFWKSRIEKFFIVGIRPDSKA